jgi:citrate lyase subunit beta/citryl-CoA lyase
MKKRPPQLRRSWLFLPGADAHALDIAPAFGADVLIQELEDFTLPEQRPAARGMATALYDAWRAKGVLAGVRVNPFETCGREDLAAVMRGKPDIVLMSKVARPEQVAALDAAVGEAEHALGITLGSTELVPNVETAEGLVNALAIARASPRITAMLVASEDMAADLGAEREPDAAELAYVRERFLVECTAAGVVAIDCPYTFSDIEGAERDARWARRRGYRSKSCVAQAHAAVINGVFTPSSGEVERAQRVVKAFEAARAAGHDRVELDGVLVEVPRYSSAKRLIERARALLQYESG